MKTMYFLLSVLFAASLSFSASAQTHDHSQMNMSSAKTVSFKVWGKCEMCQARIENAVKEAGASNASWDIKTRMLTVTYDPAKTNKDNLSKKLAAVGHDTEKYKAKDEAYEALPSCCHYDRSK